MSVRKRRWMTMDDLPQKGKPRSCKQGFLTRFAHALAQLHGGKGDCQSDLLMRECWARSNGSGNIYPYSNTWGVLCPRCQTVGYGDLRTLDRHQGAAISSLIPSLSCRMRCPNPPLPKLLSLKKGLPLCGLR